MLLLSSPQLGAQAFGTPALPAQPFGTAVTPDGALLFRSNSEAATVSLVDIDPSSPNYLREIATLPVGLRPAGVSASPDGLDVHVANFGDHTLGIIDVATLRVRKTLTSPLLKRPYDVVAGLREEGFGLAFGSDSYHGYVSNAGYNELLIYESGPDGVQGIGFDDVVGAAAPPAFAGTAPARLQDPRGVAYDAGAPRGGFALTVGAFVAHHDELGRGVVSRVSDSRDRSPGVNLIDTTAERPGFRGKPFEVVQQYRSTHLGAGLDVALADEHLSSAHPERLYPLMAGDVIDVFEIDTGAFLERMQVDPSTVDLADVLLP